MTGPVLLSSGNGAPAFTLTPGYELGPGDRVDTHGGGRVVIELTDGSMIVVQPESVIVIKDFRAAASLRELFEIMLGSVRVKINHFARAAQSVSHQQPHRLDRRARNRLQHHREQPGRYPGMVYEGVVEVTSLSDPTQSVVIEAGRGVLLVPGQGFQLFNVLSGREVAEQNRATGVPGADNHSGQMDERDLDSPRNIASIYEQYIAGSIGDWTGSLSAALQRFSRSASG